MNLKTMGCLLVAAATLGTAPVCQANARTSLPSGPQLLHQLTHRERCSTDAPTLARCYVNLARVASGKRAKPLPVHARRATFGDTGVIADLERTAAGWATVVKASFLRPNVRVPMTLSFSRSLSQSEFTALLQDIQGSVPTSSIARISEANSTITVAQPGAVGTGDTASTAPATGVQISAFNAQTQADQLETLDDEISEFQLDIRDLQATAAPGDAGAASEIAAYQAALVDYQSARNSLAATTASGTAVSVVANPNLVLVRAIRAPFLITAAAVSDGSSTASGARAGSSAAGVSAGTSDIAPASVQIAELPTGSARGATSSVQATRLAATGPSPASSMWSPVRFRVATGLYHAPRGDGLHLKRINANAVWGQPGTLAQYQADHNLGLEYQVYPYHASGLWSNDWWNKWIYPVKRRQWTSNLPDAYLDDLFGDTTVEGDTPVFAVGTANGYRLKYNALYNMRYITDYGNQDYGSVVVEPQLTEQRDGNIYCITHAFAASACQFAKTTAHVDPDHPLHLRNAGHWVCTAGDGKNGNSSDLACNRDWARDPDGVRLDDPFADSNPPVTHTCSDPNAFWNGTQCVYNLSMKRPAHKLGGLLSDK